MRAKFGLVPTAVSKKFSFKFISRCDSMYIIKYYFKSPTLLVFFQYLRRDAFKCRQHRLREIELRRGVSARTRGVK